MATENVRYILSLRDRFSANMETANESVRQLERNSEQANRTLSGIRTTLAAIGVSAVIKGIARAGIEMEQTEVAFATFLRSGEKATKVITQLNEFANVTPFNNEEVIKSGRILLAANVPAEKLTGTLKAIGDVASGSKVPLTELSSIYSKILNKGKVQAEELNQLSERGIPILQILADQYGVTTQQIFEMASQSKITADDIGTAFQTMTSQGGIFFNLMEKQSQTTGGRLSTLQGKAELLAAELGKRMLPTINSIVERLINFADTLRKNQDLIVNIVKIVARLGAAFIAYKIAIIATNKAIQLYTFLQKSMAVVTGLFTSGIKGAKAAMQAFNITTKANPIGAIIAGITLVLPLLKRLYDYITSVSAGQKAINEVNQDAIKNAASQTAGLKTIEARLKRLNSENAIYENKLLGVNAAQALYNDLSKKSVSQGTVFQSVVKKLGQASDIYNSTLDKVNKNNQERVELINQINSQYGSYLQNLLTEKSTDDEIANAIKRINEQVLLRAKLTAIQEKITDVAKQQLENELLLRDAQALKEKAASGFLGITAKIFDLANSTNLTALNESRVRRKVTKEIERSGDATQALLDYQMEIQKQLEASGVDVKTLNNQLSSPIQKQIEATIKEDDKTKELSKETKITSAAPKVITVNIDKLIENFKVETTTIKEAPIRIKEAITKALLDGVNDFVLT